MRPAHEKAVMTILAFIGTLDISERVQRHHSGPEGENCPVRRVYAIIVKFFTAVPEAVLGAACALRI